MIATHLVLHSTVLYPYKDTIIWYISGEAKRLERNVT